MTKTFTYHMVPITITPTENKNYLISARIKRKQVEVLTNDKTIYQHAAMTIAELSQNPHISKSYAQYLIGQAKNKAFQLLHDKYKTL